MILTRATPSRWTASTTSSSRWTRTWERDVDVRIETVPQGGGLRPHCSSPGVSKPPSPRRSEPFTGHLRRSPLRGAWSPDTSRAARIRGADREKRTMRVAKATDVLLASGCDRTEEGKARSPARTSTSSQERWARAKSQSQENRSQGVHQWLTSAETTEGHSSMTPRQFEA